MRCLDHHFVGGQRQFGGHQTVGFAFVEVEQFQQFFDVGVFEVVGRLLDLVLMEHIAVGHLAEGAIGVHQVIDRIDALQIHGQAFQTIGNLARHRIALDATDLLEIGELGHFHAVQPDFPAQAPGAQGGRFPVVLDKTHVMHAGIDADMIQGVEIQLLHVCRIGLENHLELVVMLQAVRVLAITTVTRSTAGLHIGGMPGLGSDGTQECCRVKGPGTHFHVIGLEQYTALFCPITLQGKDQSLEALGRWVGLSHVVCPIWHFKKGRSIQSDGA